MKTAARRASLMLALIFFTGLVTVTSSQAAPPSPTPGTKTISVTRGGATFERTVLDPVQFEGRLVRRGSVIVRFKEGVSSAAKGDAHRAAAAVQVHELKLARAERLEVRAGSERQALAALRSRAA